jgi:type IV pilus assembly protein PilB
MERYDVYEPAGCEKCGHTGFKGRVAIHETLYFTKGNKPDIFDAGDKIDEESIRAAAKKMACFH